MTPPLALDRAAESSPRATHPTSISGELEQFDPKLRCVITLTRDLALAQAKRLTRKSPPANIAVRCTASRGA